MKEAKLLKGNDKDFEHQIVSFYSRIGKMDNLSPKPTKVFGYLKVYDGLSQEQLRQLTGFSLSTISSILHSFLQADIVSRRIISGTHKYLYILKPERTKITYRPAIQIIEKLEKLDMDIVVEQDKLQKIESKYPIAARFLFKRLNSIRNYIEAQRRAIYKEKKLSFFKEDTSELVPLNELVLFPFDTKELETKIIENLGLFKGDPISNRIVSVFITHRSLDQDTLIEKTGFSRSTVSRYLRKALKGEYIRALPKEYQRPRIYYLESLALSILSVVRRTDGYAFSQIPVFQERILLLQSRKVVKKAEDTKFLITKYEETIELLERFKDETRFFRRAHDDLQEFLGKSSTQEKSSAP